MFSCFCLLSYIHSLLCAVLGLIFITYVRWASITFVCSMSIFLSPDISSSCLLKSSASASFVLNSSSCVGYDWGPLASVDDDIQQSMYLFRLIICVKTSI